MPYLMIGSRINRCTKNADDCIHQPDQRREGDDSGIIQWLIRLHGERLCVVLVFLLV